MKYLDLKYLINQIIGLENEGTDVKVVCGIEGHIDNMISDEWNYTSATFYEDGKFFKGAFMKTDRDDCYPAAKIITDFKENDFKYTSTKPQFHEGVYSGDYIKEVVEYYNNRKSYLNEDD